MCLLAGHTADFDVGWTTLLVHFIRFRGGCSGVSGAGSLSRGLLSLSSELDVDSLFFDTKTNNNEKNTKKVGEPLNRYLVLHQESHRLSLEDCLNFQVTLQLEHLLLKKEYWLGYYINWYSKVKITILTYIFRIMRFVYQLRIFTI